VTGAIRSRPSPNHGPRRDGARPDLIVLHYTAMTTAEAALDRLCDPAAEVSAHYLIAERGTVWQLVPESLRAWHAGAGRWGRVSDVNSRSVGIELANTGAHPFPAPQMSALRALMAGIMARWSIPPARVIAHSDMAPLRKSDPGRRFDWRGLARDGLTVWSDATGQRTNMGAFLRDAGLFGYDIGGNAPEAVLTAFRLRFRPSADGPLDGTDCARMADLAARFPVDRTTPTA